MSHGDYSMSNHHGYYIKNMPHQAPDFFGYLPSVDNRYNGGNHHFSGPGTSLVPGSNFYHHSQSPLNISQPQLELPHPLLSGHPVRSFGGNYHPQQGQGHLLGAPPGFSHGGPPLDEHGGEAQQNMLRNMNPRNHYNRPLEHSLQEGSSTGVIQRVSVIRKNPVVDQMEELDDDNEAAVETMKNYNTQVFIEIDEDDSFEAEEELEEYHSSWFDDSFGNENMKSPTFGEDEPKEDTSTEIENLKLRVNQLEEKLTRCEADKNYLEALLAVRDMDFARYVSLEKLQGRKVEQLLEKERKQREVVEHLLHQMEILEDEKNELLNQKHGEPTASINDEILEDEKYELLNQKQGEPTAKVNDSEITVSELINEVLSSIPADTEKTDEAAVEEETIEKSDEAAVEEETIEKSDEAAVEEETIEKTVEAALEEKIDKSSPVAGPFKEQILSLKKIQATVGLCPAEEMKLSRLEEISRTEEYLNLVPHSTILASKRKPLKHKMKCSQQIPKRPKRKAVDDVKSVCIEKKAKVVVKEKKVPEDLPSPSLWDGQTMTSGMKYAEAEVKKILELKRRDEQLFIADPARLVIYKNPALMAALTTQDDPQLVFSTWNLTSESYEEVTGEPLEATNEDLESNSDNSKNKIGRDQPKDLLKISNSKSFYQLMNTMFNKINQFSTEVPEFSTFDWLEADLNQVDFVVKLFLEWLQPLKKSSAMGDRTTTGTNKTYKTGLQNVFKFVLKRKDVELSRQSCSMSLSMMAYRGKQAAYANSGQLVPEGSRDRKPLLDSDQDLRDQWLTRPLKDIKDPEDLTLTVAAIITDQACVRGVKVLEDIGRSAFRTNLYDEEGKEFIEIKQAISRKRDQGYAAKPFRPFNKKFTGDHEVQAIKLLLSKLPPPGCKYCKGSDDLKQCLCDEWLLRTKPLESWKFNDQVWYARQSWSVWKISQMNANISKKANLSKKYTNSAARPTGITNLHRAGYTSAEISSVSEHVDLNTLEKYKKLTHLTQAADRHKAGLILAPSGRQLLRGKENQFGQVGSNEDSIYSAFKDVKLQRGSVKSSPMETSKEVPSKPVEKVDDEKKVSKPDAAFKKPPPMKATLEGVDTKKIPGNADFNSAPFKVGQKVFAKSRGFPYWPAAVSRVGYDHKKEKYIFTVIFANNQTGITDQDHIMKITEENYQLLLGQKFKKTGYEVKSNFAADVMKVQHVD